MPLYRLRRMLDNEDFVEHADNDVHALAVFGTLLNTTLTMEEGLAAPEYMMGQIEKEAHWAKDEPIPVWEAASPSN